jgi:Family of unknown function (DUF5343)
MATTGTVNPAAENTPPYLPFATLQSAISNLRTHGLPDPIDKTTWDSRSGGEQIQIVAALRFFGLLGDGNHPTQTLRALVDAQPNTAEEKTIIRGLVQASYSALFRKIDLSLATPGQVDEAIGDYQLKGSARDRAVRFFLKAASYCGITLSSRLTRNMRERTSGASGSNATTESTSEESAPAATPPVGSLPARRRRRRSGAASSGNPPPAPPETPVGNAMKTVTLPNVQGTLTISGTFNAFGLSGDERKLVYDIIDMMNAFEAKEGG